MKRNSAVLVVLAFLFLSIRCPAADSDARNAKPAANVPQVYPWSDASPYVRIPKTFLREINLFSITISNHETMEFVVAEEFANLCSVTPSEKKQLTSAVTNARHEYYKAKARHWAPSKDKANLGGREPTVIERFDFKQRPIPEARAAILEALKQQVLAILGEERAGLFWGFGGMLDSENTAFGGESKPPPGTTNSTTYTFLLRKAARGLEIEEFRETVSGGPGGRGGGAGAWRYVESFDQYAPESMRPVLARWRKTIAEANTNETQTGTTTSRPSSSGAQARMMAKTSQEPGMPVSPSGSGATFAKWENGASFVDVPKSAIKLFRIAGLTVGEEVSDEAVTLFGLTPPERRRVDALFKEMKARFEKLERAHFEQTNTTANSFVIRAFPDEAKALQMEWSRQLAGIVGIQRGPLLEESIRTPYWPNFRRGNQGFERMRPGREANWLKRGVAETRFDVTVTSGADGRPTIQNVQWAVDKGGSGGGGGGAGAIPEHWRHLPILEMLKAPTGRQ